MNPKSYYSACSRTKKSIPDKFGMGFEEVTASSLLKIDHEGNVIEEGPWGQP